MQVALALVLLVASGLMIRTFQTLRNVIQVLRIRRPNLHLSISQATVPGVRSRGSDAERDL